MPVANNLLAGTVLAPVLALLSALSLSFLQRALDWVSSVAKNPQKGYLRQIKPYMKVVDTTMERIFAGNKFVPTTTNILLMAVVILLLALLLEGGEKPKTVRIVEKRKDE
eukprot:gene27032-32665_t